MCRHKLGAHPTREMRRRSEGSGHEMKQRIAGKFLIKLIFLKNYSFEYMPAILNRFIFSITLCLVRNSLNKAEAVAS